MKLTNLARGGVASRVAMAPMRHSNRRLTDKIYTDENLLGTWAAFDCLPNCGERASQGASQILGAGGQTVALAGTTGGGAEVGQTPIDMGDYHVLASCGTAGQNAGNGGSGGAQTRHISNEIKGETRLPSQRASQNSGASADLRRVIDCWPALSEPLKNAISAIVKAVADREGL